MNVEKLVLIYEKIKEAKSILIVTHRNPDGDAIGSACALSLVIEKLNIPVDMLVTNIPEFVSILPNGNKLITSVSFEYDLIIMVDVSSGPQLGMFEDLFLHKNKIIIDHHNGELEDDITGYISPEAASTTMILYQFMISNNIDITYDLALPLYLGLLTDTGGFAHNNTTSEVLLIASKLLGFGIDHNSLYTKLIRREYTMDHLYLQKIAIDNLEIIDKKIAFTFLDYKNLSKYKHETPKDFVYVGLNLIDTEVGIIIIEEEPNSYRVSLRSKKYVDVSEIAKVFDGGGHIHAAGVRFIGDFDSNKNKIIEEIKKRIKE